MRPLRPRSTVPYPARELRVRSLFPYKNFRLVTPQRSQTSPRGIPRKPREPRRSGPDAEGGFQQCSWPSAGQAMAQRRLPSSEIAFYRPSGEPPRVQRLAAPHPALHLLLHPSPLPTRRCRPFLELKEPLLPWTLLRRSASLLLSRFQWPAEGLRFWGSARPSPCSACSPFHPSESASWKTDLGEIVARGGLSGHLSSVRVHRGHGRSVDQRRTPYRTDRLGRYRCPV